MFPKISRFRSILCFWGMLLTLTSWCPSQPVAQVSQPQVLLPERLLSPPHTVLASTGADPRWLRLSVRPSGVVTVKISLPAEMTNEPEPLCLLNLQFANNRTFRDILGEFSLGAANIARAKFSARMGTKPKGKEGKTLRRLFARGAMFCASTEESSNPNSAGSVRTSQIKVLRISKARKKPQTPLESFVRSFLLGKLRQSAYRSKAHFTFHRTSTLDLNDGAPRITLQTSTIFVDPFRPSDIVAYVQVAGKQPLNYSWNLIDRESSLKVQLIKQSGVRTINDATGSTLIAYGDVLEYVGKALQLSVTNGFGEALSGLIPIENNVAANATNSPEIDPTLFVPAATNPNATPTIWAAPTKTQTPLSTTSPSPTSASSLITPTPLSPATNSPHATPSFPASPTATPSPNSTQTPTPTPLAFGYDSRPSNSTCLAPERSSGTAPFTTTRAFSKLSFVEPVKIAQAPADSTRFYVAEKSGIIHSFQNSLTVAETKVFADLSAKVTRSTATGLMSFAFHPEWPKIPLVFVTYVGGNLESRLSAFETRDGGKTLDPESEAPILRVNQPNPRHTIGELQFGPDRLLYVGLGDGALPSKDANGNSQNPGSLLGKLLRIDIDGTTNAANYRIPPDNPYPAGELCGTTKGASTSSNCAEIFAVGFRNPWRFSVDPTTNKVWVGDVGQSAIEEVNQVTPGGNYGWNCFEGTKLYLTACNQTSGSILSPPIAQYNHSDGGYAITGGYVYRGNAIPELFGRYIFGDYITGNIWSIPLSTNPTKTVTSSNATSSQLNIVSFGIDLSGEIYIVDYSGGGIHKIVPVPTQNSGGVAPQLSATGCVDPNNPTQPANGLIPFEPIAPLWSDGSQKQRWLALPDGESITITSNGDLDFPPGSVLMKNFKLNSRLIETRLLMRHPDGIWKGYSYRWNDEQTDAVLVEGGITTTAKGQIWTFPSSSQCMACHTQPAGMSLGPETLQLNSDLLYTETNRFANQLRTMDHIELFTPVLPDDPTKLPRLAAPLGSEATLNERARSYLHSNCSHCHQPRGGAPVNIDLRFSTDLLETLACDQPPLAGDLGISNARIIAPGDPDRSVLVSRMNRRDSFQMPPLGTHSIDTDGVGLISDWIKSFTNCE